MEASGESIWYKDISSLFNADNFGCVVPTSGMTLAQQLNSILRFSVYYSLIMFAARQNADAFVFPVITAAVTYIVFQHFSGGGSEGFGARNDQDGPCTEPTRDNPFMNLLANEYNTAKPGACDPLDEDVRESMEQNFYEGAFVDQDDIYNRNSGSRQFYTNPVTTSANDQGAFADWLYGGVNCSGKQVRPPPLAG